VPYLPGVPVPLITVVELATFDAAVRRFWDEIERWAFIDFVARNPTAGVVIPGTGGIRKLRWSGSGRGKRGGARVIYFYHDRDMPVFLLTAYTKSERADLGPEDRKRFVALVASIKESYGR
jgi:mRNA-degrading endonuclease RelE of RelBE toxin-antitoxin system